ncbi:NnrS family protein [uncultured Paraglaciecola sp.]|uniref:NnrS family protein n=1 Tax=uncultured Paraglaciecola sp. TaxID=1765024 RepID=UPI0030D96D46|tara:strand:- start:75081 stop:76283 length:1203 start_codon:yes stop_codon:yes gene_type:complete
MNISEPNEEQKITPIWRQAFRPFFLFACLFAILSISAWALVQAGQLYFMPYGGVIFWHAHEMLFGFVAAIIVGFLLTAVQSWTGLRATHGKPLMVLFTLWLVGRLVMLLDLFSNQWINAVFDMSFLLLAAFFMAKLVLKVKQYRNLIFVPILLLLATANLFTHLSVMTGEINFYTQGMYATVMIITLIMTVVAGRVFPMFTANGTQTTKVDNLAWLEKTVISLTALLVLVHLTGAQHFLTSKLMVFLYIACSLAHSIRAIRWRPQVTFKTPLVWSLHLAYWFIPISFLLFALHYGGVDISASNALHGLTAGAMSSLILAMIARIALGHTGRPLAPHWCMKYAFALIVLAGSIRIISPHLQTYFSFNLNVLSAVLWALAFGIYVVIYTPILITPRPDGRPG